MANLDFIVAKVRGMRGKLYEHERLSPLCSAPSVEDLAASLAPGQPVGDVIGLQRHLTARHVAALYPIATWLDGAEAETVLWILRRYQAENLKVILRAWAAKGDESLLARYSVQVPEELALPAHAMLKAPDMESLIKQIPVRQFRDGALLGLGEFEESTRLFFIEAGIDQAYFSELARLAEQGKAPAREPVLRLVQLELDIYNTMFVLRGLFNYSVLFNKLRPLLAPLGAHLTVRALEHVRTAPDLAAAIPLLPDSLVGRENRPATGDELEAALWQNLYHTANRIFYTSVLEFGAIVAFCYIKRVELSNLIRISECIRYGEHGDAILQKLIALSTPEPVRSG